MPVARQCRAAGSRECDTGFRECRQSGRGEGRKRERRSRCQAEIVPWSVSTSHCTGLALPWIRKIWSTIGMNLRQTSRKISDLLDRLPGVRRFITAFFRVIAPARSIPREGIAVLGGRNRFKRKCACPAMQPLPKDRPRILRQSFDRVLIMFYIGSSTRICIPRFHRCPQRLWGFCVGWPGNLARSGLGFHAS